jgi:hypothetical protein
MSKLRILDPSVEYDRAVAELAYLEHEINALDPATTDHAAVVDEIRVLRNFVAKCTEDRERAEYEAEAEYHASLSDAEQLQIYEDECLDD